MIIVDQLEKIKRRLGIEDNLQDELLTDLIEDTMSHFKVLTGVDTIEDKYSFIVRDVAVLRYNRKGSEGMSSESVDGYSTSYIQEDFKQYMDILERDFNITDKTRKKGKVFII